jgi:hypothetical protein
LLAVTSLALGHGSIASAAEADPTPVATSPEPPSSPSPAPNDVATVEAQDAPEDPTGGAYTSPTLLFTPAAAAPRFAVRLIPSTTVQSPSDVHAGFRPGLGVEVGLGHGFTVGAGTNWVGGDINPDTGNTYFPLGLSPYLQARLHLHGSADGQGFQLGAALGYKFVGFGGATSAGQDPGEMEISMSAQLRHTRYELGLQGVLGQDFGDGQNHDAEVHAYALYRVLPQLGIGAAGQVRVAIAPSATDPNAPPAYTDVIGGGIASLTLGRYQVGALAGASTIGIAPDRPTVLAKAGAAGQLFGSFRFN